MRSRVLVDVLLLVLSFLAVAIAVLGPLLVRATQQATVIDSVANAGTDTALTVYGRVNAKAGLGLLETGTIGALVPVATGPSAGLWEPLQQWTETSENVAWQRAGADGSGEAYSRLRLTNGCADLVVTGGRCPAKTGETLVSTSDVEQRGVAVGDDVIGRIGGVVTQSFGLRVVGTYDPARVAAPLTRPGTEKAATAIASGDPLVVVADQLTSLTISAQVSARLALRQPVSLAEVPLMQEAVAELNASSASDPNLVVDTRLPDVLDHISSQSRASVVLIVVVEAQALGIALFAVFVVLARVARARSAEWGAGRLLGVSVLRWLRSVYLEPATALLLGVPLGYVVAVAIGQVAVRSGLRAGTPYEVWRWPVLAAAAGAGVVVVLALVVVTLPSLRRPLAELVSQRSEAAGTTPLGAAAQAVVLLLAGLTVYILLAGDVLGGRGPQLGLLAPALFGLALAVLGIRLAVVLVRRRARRPARSLSGLVVARQAARTPSSLSPAVVVTIGVALLVFAGQLLAVSVRNQDLKATAVVGAATVLHVTTPAGTDLIAAVDRADPSGRSAMAVRERDAAGAVSTDRVVAVDSSRLAAVTSWSLRWAGVPDVAAALRPPTGEPIRLQGSRLDVRLAQVSVAPVDPLYGPKKAPDPALSMTLDTGSRWQTVDLGRLAGRRQLTAAIPCTSGCRVVDLGVSSDPNKPYTASFVITDVETDTTAAQGPPGWLTQEGRWHVQDARTTYDADPIASAQIVPQANGLSVLAKDESGGSRLSVDPSDVLNPLPALLGPLAQQDGTPAGEGSNVFGLGLDGNAQLLHVVGTAQALPRALADGAMIDLRSAQDLIDPQKDSSPSEVWLAPDAPADIERSLVSAGFVITGREHLGETQAQLVREPTTRAAAVALTVAGTAALLTLLALIASRIVGAPRRRLDWRSLADAGVGPRQLRTLCGVEVAVPSLLAVALGAVGGLVAFVLSVPRLPVVDLTTPGPPLQLGVDWLLTVLTVTACAVVVVVVALLAAAAETRKVDA